MDCKDYNGSEVAEIASAAVILGGAAPAFSTSLDSSTLVPGHHYRLCISVDPGAVQPTYFDSGQAVYATGVRDSSTVNVLAQNPATFIVQCADGCSTATVVYLGLSCDSTVTSGSHDGVPAFSTSAVALSQTGPGAFMAVVDAGALVPGAHQVCADLDGPQGMAFGDTQVQINVLASR